jgi:8-oxo-dGTP pyrophosphatase MutT (NUDIX family)
MGHINKLYDFTTSAFIINDKRVLLLSHKKIGKWLQPGGHIELNEDPLQALYREIHEETGLKHQDLKIINVAKDMRKPSLIGNNKVLPIPFDINVHNFNKSHKHIDLCFLMLSKTDAVVNEDEKSHDLRWFSVKEVENLYRNNKVFADTLELTKLALKHTE